MHLVGFVMECGGKKWNVLELDVVRLGCDVIRIRVWGTLSSVWPAMVR